ncbi:Usher syndrome type-1G protein [Cimex lectularius]|uniref:NAD(+) ADP-ribosyltransferase n=1 Tax=Cimex lectularius TaxID=79782 RepID=A0A8I6SBD1_CIMLE|nr:Usher syndrome type-1G protein [Cimex lectularius]
MSLGRFHKAAQDGHIEILKESTKRECNAKDEDGMTPTLWAANNGHLDALRLLVGRGGDIEKTNYHFGQTALHLAAAKGHLPCVSFLVGFDANLFALDHDLHTPLQIATNREVIDFLDKAMAKQLIYNKKEVKAKKEKALKDAERRRKKYDEKMKKERDKEEKRIKKEIGTRIEKDTPIPTIPNNTMRKAVVAVNGPTFTEIVGGTLSKKPVTGMKKILEKKLRHDDKYESGTKGHNKKDAQIIYVNSYENPINGKRGKISDIFSSQTGINNLHQQASIFDRPGFGSVAFRQRSNLAGTLSGTPGSDVIFEKDGEEEVGSETSIGSAGSLANRQGPQHAWNVDDITTSDEENVVSNGQWSPLERFLVSAGVEEYTPKLLEQQVDLEAVLMLTDEDLIQLGVPMGPRRKLLHAVEQRKQALKNPGLLQDTRL